MFIIVFFFFQAEDGIRDADVTGVQTCALPIWPAKSWRGGTLTSDDRRFLRAVARRTWRYFDDFVGPQTSWLPPDNVQETPTREIFMRTSPTNIGLSMLATVAANDFGYITIDDLVERNLRTLETLSRL